MLDNNHFYFHKRTKLYKTLHISEEMDEYEYIYRRRTMEIETKPLKVYLDDRGYLFEALRKDDKLFDGVFGQVKNK